MLGIEPGPLKEQPVLLAIEPSLQLPSTVLERWQRTISYIKAGLQDLLVL